MKTDFLKLSSPILIASDHGGFDLKLKLKSHFNELTFTDLGPANTDSVNYPDFAHKLCKQLSSIVSKIEEDPNHMGILICGSGQGMAMAANKYKNLRAALCWNKESAQLARSHNNAQLLCIGARLLDEITAIEVIDTFFSTKFEGGRHINRIKYI